MNKPLLASLKCLVGLALSSTLLSPATAAVITFDSLLDAESVTGQFAGLGATFSNAVALRSGFSLNEFEFPPRSGDLVVSDDGGALAVLFSTPVSEVSGYFTYATAITMSAFDASNNLLGSISSIFGSNLALSGAAGASPNELLQLAFGSGISRITVAGDPAGASFVLDDFSFTPVVRDVSAPGTACASLLALGILAGLRRTHGRGRLQGRVTGTTP
ncbi:MAG: hypothetical protein KIT17_00550 [Rubrivivax sp.]|nr:hypothetical protein [Rubrivivax sp.]